MWGWCLVAATLGAGLVATGPRSGGGQPAAARTNPPAIVGGRAVNWSEMTPLLAEAAGAAVLEEIVLDRALAAELERAKVTITEQDVERERVLLARSMARAAQAGPDEVEEIVRTVRRQRGLGEKRFAALLRRNAALRRLVQGDVVVTPEDVRRAYDVRYGERMRTRLIVTATERAAAEALARVRGGEGREAEPFGEVAAELSTDPSAARGGIVEPISPLDPTYPAAVRQALSSLKPGEISSPVGIEEGFVILKLEEVLPPSGPAFEDVRAEMEEEVRLVRERVQMDRLAARLLKTTPVIIMDEDLDWSWTARRERNTR